MIIWFFIVYTFLMFLGEMVGGFIFYRYQKGVGNNKIKFELSRESILISRLRKTEMKRADGIPKIIFSSFYDIIFRFF